MKAGGETCQERCRESADADLKTLLPACDSSRKTQEQLLPESLGGTVLAVRAALLQYMYLLWQTRQEVPLSPLSWQLSCSASGHSV